MNDRPASGVEQGSVEEVSDRGESTLLRAEQVAQRLGVKKQRIYALVRQGAIPFVRLGEKQIRFSAPVLERWIARGGGDASS